MLSALVAVTGARLEALRGLAPGIIARIAPEDAKPVDPAAKAKTTR
jgi:hypothetical protein